MRTRSLLGCRKELYDDDADADADVLGAEKAMRSRAMSWAETCWRDCLRAASRALELSPRGVKVTGTFLFLQSNIEGDCTYFSTRQGPSLHPRGRSKAANTVFCSIAFVQQ